MSLEDVYIDGILGRWLYHDYRADLRELGEEGLRRAYLSGRLTTAEFERFIGELLGLAETAPWLRTSP